MNSMRLDLLTQLLAIPSPSGFEFEIQKFIQAQLGPIVDQAKIDRFGNLYLSLQSDLGPKLMISSHADEIGMMVRFISEDGFIYFNGINEDNLDTILGQRVDILSETGPIRGVISGKHGPIDGKRKINDLWIDIGTKNNHEAKKRVGIGDMIVCEQNFSVLANNRAIARGFDNKIGCFILAEMLKSLVGTTFQFALHAVFSAQEEVGWRGALVAAETISPQIAIVIDVIEASDYPDTDQREMGEIILEHGPVIYRGPNIDRLLYKDLIKIAKQNNLAVQIFGEPWNTPTDARVIQLSGQGVATVVVSVPVRYIHTPSEMVSLVDVENTILLLCAFVKNLAPIELA
jgi:putative aminopeptidase FrvX